MSHELEIVNGEAQMAYVGQKPWHSLGVELEEGVSPQEIQKAAGLDWAVEKQPIYCQDNFNNQIQIPGKKALVRSSDNKILDIVGDTWNPVQNDTAFEFFNQFCEEGSMQMHTAGSLKGGTRVWALAKINEDFEIFGGDKVEGYMLFSNPHKFGHCVDVRFTPIRVVCNNTLTFALDSVSQHMVKMNHRSEFDPEAVKVALGVSKERMDEYKNVASFLGSKRITDEQYKEFLGKVLGTVGEDMKLSRNAQMAYDVMDTQPGAEFAQGTFWSALNSVTYVMDHKVGRSADTRLNSNWFGLGRTKKMNAVNTALEMAS